MEIQVFNNLVLERFLILIKNLNTFRDLQGLAAFTISNVAKIRKARKIVRKCQGLPKLVSTMQDFFEVNQTRTLVKVLCVLVQSITFVEI